MASDFAASSNYDFSASRTRAAGPAGVLDEEAPAFPTTPIYARKRKTSGFAGVSPAALIGGGAVVVALAGVVLAMSLAGPGEPDTVQMAEAPVAQSPAPMTPATSPADPALSDPMAMTPTESEAAPPPAAPVERVAAAEPRREARAPRVRPAAAPAAAASATDSAEDASAMLPAAPMPYVPEGEDAPAATPAAGAEPAAPATIAPAPLAVPPVNEAPAATPAPSAEPVLPDPTTTP
jgi:cytoskeletal protein RodZ